MTKQAKSANPIRELLTFPLISANFGRRARRFAMGMEIPSGPLAFKSRHAPVPLSELEQAILERWNMRAAKFDTRTDQDWKDRRFAVTVCW
jgi:hypothetical protein